MTYCVGFSLQDGLVFASDSRTNAGVDYVTRYSKMHVFNPAEDRSFVLLSAGNLATTQEIVNRIKRDLEYPDGTSNLLSARYLFEAADYIGRMSVEVQDHHRATLQGAGISGEVSLLLGGQIQGQKHGLMLIYPQGNYIEASVETPYLQIGETKYGKPVLDRVVHYDMGLEDAARLALVSLSSTAKSNITVGPPFELLVCRSGQFEVSSRCRFDEKGDYLQGLDRAWKSGLISVFASLPRFEWEGERAPRAQEQQAGVIPQASDPNQPQRQLQQNPSAPVQGVYGCDT